MSGYDELVRRLQRILFCMANEEEDTLLAAIAAIWDLEAEVERLKGVLERLASSEAFHQSHVLVARDAELIMRMDFARSALEAKP